MEKGKKFESVKWDDTKMFRSVPDFVYEYKETEEIDGHEVYHIGEGVYMFRENIPFGDGTYIDELQKKYPDLRFILYKRSKIIFGENGFMKGMDSICGIHQLVFVMSGRYRQHDEHSLYVTLCHDISRFSIADENMEVIKDFLYYAAEKNNMRSISTCSEDDWRVSLDEYENFRYRESEWTEDMDEVYGIDDVPNREDGDCSGIVGKLGFRYTPERYEKINGWIPYIIYRGRIGKYVCPGIYHFEDSLYLSDSLKEDLEVKYTEEYRIYPCGSDLIYPDNTDGDIRFGYLGVQRWSGGSISMSEGIGIRYIGFGEAGISLLKKMEKMLPRYTFNVTMKTERKQPGKKQSFLGFVREAEKKKNAYVMRENAVELLEGLGFRNHEIKCEVLFQSERMFYNYDRYDYAYVSGDYLVLVSCGKEVEIPLSVITTLRVIRHRDMGADIREETAITVIDRREAMERDFLGDEAYEKYVKYIRKDYN